MNLNCKYFIIILYIYTRDFKIHSERGFVDIDNGSKGGTHWACH